MSSKITVFGCGPVGRATAQQLAVKGETVRIVQRKAPPELPKGASFHACDVLDPDAVRAAVKESSQVVVAIGFAYLREIWRKSWPLAMQNLVAACGEQDARMVFVDNLYMYGPQHDPLKEDMPLTDYEAKPRARADATRIWMEASAAGRVRAAALRAPDFYGPDVALSQLGEYAFGALAKNKRAWLLAPPDMPHDFAYVPDIARAVISLLEAPDDAFGQAWHVPCAPVRTCREILELGAKALDHKLRLSAIPLWSIPAIGLLSPLMREMVEMRFQWDRPYRVDSSKFAKRFWSDATSFEIGAEATARSFRTPK